MNLCMHWYNVIVEPNEIWGCKNPVVSLLNTTQLYRRKSLLYWGVRTLLCRCWTQPNYIGNLRAAGGHATFLCPGTQKNKERYGSQPTACLLSVESESSVLYLLDVLLGTLTNTLRCPGATETQGNASERRTRWWLCCVWRKRGVSQATLVSETKEARDMVLTSDWLKWR